MASQKITELPVATATVSGDKYYVVQGGVDKQIDFDNFPFANKKVTIAASDIDWSLGSTYQKTFTGTPTVVITDSNLPQGTNTKTITMYLTGAVTSITFPAYWVKMGGSTTYDGSVVNQYVIECRTGTAASEQVYYSNSKPA